MSDDFVKEFMDYLHEKTYDFEDALGEAAEDVSSDVYAAMEQAEYATHQLIRALENYIAKTNGQ